jgi:hypothetical protein
VLRIILIFFLGSLSTTCQHVSSISQAEGINPSQSNYWQLITSRFRSDTKEIRLTYANDIARKKFTDNLSSFDDGAKFLKVSFLAADDPDFTSSKMPGHKTRTQIMVKDRKMYTSTDGWGYYIYDANNLPMPNLNNNYQMACATCHRTVSHRDHVFSVPMDDSFLGQQKGGESQHIFNKVNIKRLPPELQKVISQKFDSAHILVSPLNHSYFLGTLDEVRPMLIKKAYMTHGPVVFLADDLKTYSMILPDSSYQGCPESQMPYKAISFSSERINNKLILDNFCQAHE